MATEQPYDVIVLDVMSPLPSGNGRCRRARVPAPARSAGTGASGGRRRPGRARPGVASRLPIIARGQAFQVVPSTEKCLLENVLRPPVVATASRLAWESRAARFVAHILAQRAFGGG
jgi:hypothetical protein